MSWLRLFLDPIVSNPKRFLVMFLLIFAPFLLMYYATLGIYIVDREWVMANERGLIPIQFMPSNRFALYWIVHFPLFAAFSFLLAYLTSMPLYLFSNVKNQVVYATLFLPFFNCMNIAWIVSVKDVYWFVVKVIFHG